MDFDLKGLLEAFVLENELGILKTKNPIELEEKDFINLLNSGMVYDIELNQEVPGKDISYYHVATYKGIEFLGQSESCIYDL